MLQEAMAQGIVNYANLAEQIQPSVEKMVGKPVEQSAIVMSLRRMDQQEQQHPRTRFRWNSEILMKSGLCDITLVRSPSLLTKIKRMYDLIDPEKGETLNIIQGNYEVTIIIGERHLPKLLKILEGEKVINKEKGLVALTMSFAKDFLYTPGILAKVTRRLAWEHINVFENISTLTEMIFIIHQKDALRAYTALEQLIEEQDHETRDI